MTKTKYLYIPESETFDPYTVAIPHQVVCIKHRIEKTEFVRIETPDGNLDLGMVLDDALYDLPVGIRFNHRTGLPLDLQLV